MIILCLIESTIKFFYVEVFRFHYIDLHFIYISLPKF